MSGRFLKVQLFVVGTTLSIAMLLFAAQRREAVQAPQFRSVIDLTQPQLANPLQNTVLVAPSSAGGAWTVDSLPPARLVGPLALIRAQHKNFPSSESLVTMDDVAAYESTYGAIPQGAVVLVDSQRADTAPIVCGDALRFLVEARNIVALGNAGTEVVGPSDDAYVARNGIYQLRNVTNLSILPRSGPIAMVAPQKLPDESEAPVRFMALLK
jgi:kynurenine formamidase